MSNKQRVKQNRICLAVFVVTTLMFTALMVWWGYYDRGYYAFGGEGFLPIIYVYCYIRLWRSKCREYHGGKTEQK